MCGIFGYIGTKKPLNKSIFATLGVCNDSRGGDNCGIMINRQVEYGGEDRLFTSFYTKSKLLKNTGDANIAVGHCRKASVGGIAEALAQPVIIKDENNPISFVLLHNGTIKNAKDLADKYKVKYEGSYSDSQIMALLFYSIGFDVLKEYDGAGAFVCIDYRTIKKGSPVVSIFRGKSKQTWNGQPEEERPLYGIQTEDKQGMWFSSLWAPLSSLFYEQNQKCFNFTANTLFTIINGTIVSSAVYDRTQLEFNHSYRKYPINLDIYKGRFSYDKHSFYDKDIEVEEEESIFHQKKEIISKEKITTKVISSSSKSGFHDIEYYDGYYYDMRNPQAVLMHGSYRMSAYGYINEHVAASAYFCDFYFYQGILLKHPVLFTVLENIANNFKMSPSKFMEDAYGKDMVFSCSFLPFLDNVEPNLFYENIIKSEKRVNSQVYDVDVFPQLYSGNFTIPFVSNNTWIIVQGKILPQKDYITGGMQEKLFQEIKAAYALPEIELSEFLDNLELFALIVL